MSAANASTLLLDRDIATTTTTTTTTNKDIEKQLHPVELDALVRVEAWEKWLTHVQSGTIGSTVMIMGLAFLLEGIRGLTWIKGWIFVVTFNVASAVMNLYMVKNAPQIFLMRQGADITPDQPASDKAATRILLFSAILNLPLAPLNEFCFHWWIISPTNDSKAGIISLTYGALPMLLLAVVLMLVVVPLQNPYARKNLAPQGPEQELITSGVYSHVRHPMYSALVILQVSLSLYFNSMLHLAVITSFMFVGLSLRIRLEETQLREKFGVAHEDYVKKVPKILIPYLL